MLALSFIQCIYHGVYIGYGLYFMLSSFRQPYYWGNLPNVTNNIHRWVPESYNNYNNEILHNSWWRFANRHDVKMQHSKLFNGMVWLVLPLGILCVLNHQLPWTILAEYWSWRDILGDKMKVDAHLELGITNQFYHWPYTCIHEIATIPDGKWQQSEGSQMVF